MENLFNLLSSLYVCPPWSDCLAKAKLEMSWRNPKRVKNFQEKQMTNPDDRPIVQNLQRSAGLMCVELVWFELSANYSISHWIANHLRKQNDATGASGLDNLISLLTRAKRNGNGIMYHHRLVIHKADDGLRSPGLVAPNGVSSMKWTQCSEPILGSHNPMELQREGKLSNRPFLQTIIELYHSLSASHSAESQQWRPFIVALSSA